MRVDKVEEETVEEDEKENVKDVEQGELVFDEVTEDIRGEEIEKTEYQDSFEEQNIVEVQERNVDDDDDEKEEEEEEEEGKRGGGGEECEKDKIMTEKEDRTVSGLAQSRDLFESQDEDNLKRSQYCVCNNILCDCDENPESKSLLDNC